MSYNSGSNRARNFKSALRFALGRFWNYSPDYSLNWTPLGPITITYLMKSFALLINAEQNLSLTFTTVHQLITNVSLTVLLYELPVAKLHSGKATRFSTLIASRRIAFCQTSWGPTRPEMCSNVSLCNMKFSRQRLTWSRFNRSCSNQNYGLGYAHVVSRLPRIRLWCATNVNAVLLVSV